MNNERLLADYKKRIISIKNRALELKISDKQFNEIYDECLNEPEHKPKSSNSFIRLLIIIFGLVLICYILLNVHQPTSSIVLRNVQGLIHPGFKIIRLISMPVIKMFPRLTELYDEACLIENPYFYVNNMECWPCENVHSVINLTGFSNYSLYGSGIPFIIKSDQKSVLFKDIKNAYLNYKEIFDKDANRIKSTNYTLKHVNDLIIYEPKNGLKTHISWRINRMLPARIIRTLFPRPHIVSEWSGQSIERFVMIDGSQASSYALPTFECSYVFMIQGSGERTIIFKPSRECGNKCRTVSVVLKPSHVLWYNWWYWRPISLPVTNSSEVSISYINSYC